MATGTDFISPDLRSTLSGLIKAQDIDTILMRLINHVVYHAGLVVHDSDARLTQVDDVAYNVSVYV